MATSTIPTSITQYQTGFAPEIAPYAQNMLGATQGTVFQYKKDEGGQNILDEQGMPIISGFQPYQSYPTQDRFAQFTPLQQRAFSGAENMMPSQTTSGASQLAGMAGLGALGTGYQPLNFQSQSILGNRGGMGGGRGGFGGGRDNFGFGGGQGNLNVGYDSGSQTPRMSGGGNDNGMGGFGGGFGGGMGGGFGGFGMPQNNLGAYMSPYMQNVVGIQQREAQRNADIAGTQQQAQATKAGAFGGGRDAIMRAEAARNLATQKGDIQAKGLQDAYTQAMGQFNTEQQARQQAAQLGEQSRQYGAGLGLQGLQTALSGANTLGQLGQQQFQQGIDINKLQSQYGGEQQKQMQGMLEADYQDFINRQNYPYKQLGFMSDMLRGAPLSQTGSSVYQQPPSMLGQMTGLATGLGSLFGGKKEGGSVKSYAGGGELSITNPDDSKLERMMDGMSDGQLQQIINGSANPDARRVAQEELMSRSSISHAMARGGMIAFKNGGDEGEKKDDSSGVSGLAYLAAAFPGLFQAGKAVIGPAASSIGSALKAVGTGVSNAGSAYMSPAASAVLAGGLKASDWSTKMLDQASDEQLEGMADSGDPNLALSAAILREGRRTEQKKQEYADEVGGGRGKTPSSAYDVQAMAEHLGKSTRGPTARDNKGGASAASQRIVQGATRIAEQQGVPREDFEAIIDRMMNKFKGANDKDLEGLAKMVAEEKENAKSIMGDATRQALAKFGFQMAANASQPGAGKGFAGLLKSAASAGPALAESMAESRKAAQAAQDNARRMQIEFTKYKVALSKGDQQTAISLASNIRMMQQQQTQLEETIRHNKASEGLMSQRVAAMSGRGQEKTFAPMLRAIGQANQQAIKATEGYMKTPKGMADKRPYGEILGEFETRFRKSAVPMFGPTGKVYGNDDDDMEG
jgi:hypothetical protein